MPWTSKSPYFGEDEAAADRLWDDINIDNGTVALSDTFVEAMGLPTAQRFPWDQEKGVYLLNGFHSLHCLVREIDVFLVNCGNGKPNQEVENHSGGRLGV